MNNEYKDFVLSFLSSTSKNSEELISRLKYVESQGINPAMLLCASLGISGEGSEIADLVKKILYQGKDFDREKIIRELGDLRFYVEVMYSALNASDEEIKMKNEEKLRARYPNGFTIENSEHRKSTDT